MTAINFFSRLISHLLAHYISVYDFVFHARTHSGSSVVFVS